MDFPDYAAVLRRHLPPGHDLDDRDLPIGLTGGRLACLLADLERSFGVDLPDGTHDSHDTVDSLWWALSTAAYCLGARQNWRVRKGRDPMTEPTARTLFDHLRTTLRSHGDSRSVTFLRESRTGMADDRRTFAELDRRAREIAAGLSARVPRGARVLLLYPQGPEFLEAFLGCLYAGVVSVPAPMPQYRRSVERILGILADAGAELVLTQADCLDQLSGQLAGLAPAGHDIRCVATDVPGFGAARDWRSPCPDPDSVVYLQYTSGSTSEPKGVAVTQDNLLHNGGVIRRRWLMDDRSVVVGWIPHFHDMGLISLLLQPLQVGCDCAFTAPLSFVKRPVLWLRMITRFRATTVVAPDFAYDLCTDRVTDAQLAELDLSSLRVAGTGSEPVRVATMDAFARRFAPAGFRRGMFSPCYGLAEATLLVNTCETGAEPTMLELDRDLLERNEVRETERGAGVLMAGHGPSPGVDVRIVAPDTGRTRPDGEVGEIWVAGRSVAAGYWNQPEATAATFHATTAEGDGPYLRTGDLGFRYAGELFITGRLKDLIIVQGRNLYPQDVEFTVRDLHPALRDRPGAAFSVAAGREHIVLVQEVKTSRLGGIDLAELAAIMRQAIVTAFDVPHPSIVLVDQPVPRTTSSKVQRRATKARFLSGELTPVHEALEPALAAYLAAGRPEPVATISE